MLDFAKVYAENPNGVLATRSGEEVRTRVFQYLFTEGKKVFFCTSNQKDVCKELKADPQVSFCSYPANFSPVVSVNGRAVFVDDRALKARVLDENPAIRGIYEMPDNPVFEVFYIDVSSVDTFSFTEGPRKYTQ